MARELTKIPSICEGSIGSAAETNKDMTGPRTGFAYFVPPGSVSSGQLCDPASTGRVHYEFRCELNNLGQFIIYLAFPTYNMADEVGYL